MLWEEKKERCLSSFKHPEEILYIGSNRTFNGPHKEIPSGYFLSARKISHFGYVQTVLVFVIFTVGFEQKRNLHKVFNWSWNSLVSLSSRLHCASYKLLCLELQKQRTGNNIEAPDPSPSGASHHITQPFQNALIRLQVVTFLLPLLRWRLYQTSIIYSWNFLISQLSLFMASLRAYILQPALFCNMQSS